MDAAETRLKLAPLAKRNSGDAPGPRQEERENEERHREKIEHEMRDPVQGTEDRSSLALMSATLILRYIE